MRYGVRGQWEAGFAIEGQWIPFSSQLVEELTVRSGLHRSLPTFVIKVKDRLAAMMTELGIKDGLKVRVELGDGYGGMYSGNFRVLGGPARAMYSPAGIYLQFGGVLDHIAWMRKISTEHVKGPSGAMIAKLAGQAGLGADIDGTNDMQVWLPNRKTLFSYAMKVASHGWAGPSSCMLLAVTDKGVCRYKNLESMIGGGRGLRFGPTENGEIFVHQMEVNDKSAAYNQSGAYGSTTIGEKLPGKVYDFAKVAGLRLSQFSSFSDAIGGALGEFGGRLDFNPIDNGNVHKMYHEARHQNRRIKSTFGFDVHLLVHRSTGAQIFDMAHFNAVNPVTKAPLHVYSGDYIVTNRVMTVRSNRYLEKVTLTAQGPNA